MHSLLKALRHYVMYDIDGHLIEILFNIILAV